MAKCFDNTKIKHFYTKNQIGIHYFIKKVNAPILCINFFYKN